MAAMREDRAPVKWNKKFIYPKSQRSLIQGKRHYDIDDTGTKLPECHDYYFRNPVGGEATGVSGIGKQDSGTRQQIELGI